MRLVVIKTCFLIFLQFGIARVENDNLRIEKLRRAIVNFLNNKFGDRKVEYVIDLKTNVDERLIQSGDEIYVVQKSGSGYKGYQTFKIKVCSNGKCKEILIQALVRTFENILFAKKDLKRGELMESNEKIFDSFSVGKVETTFLKDDLVLDAKAILGKRIKKFIRRDEIIFGSYFEDLPLIKAGEKVRVIAEIGNVKIETSGIAKANGKLNDFVRVLNPESGKLFYAKVIGRGVVKVEIEN